jgi:endonuclease/exonuclease/phosphatase family metal-dependent hydrolase
MNALQRTAKKARMRVERFAADRRARAVHHFVEPHLCLLRAPALAPKVAPLGRELTVATYNVPRWTGRGGRGRPDPARAGFVISELRADVIALQEALRPLRGDDVLEQLADGLGLHLAFAATRVHRDGELGNAILSRWPIGGVSMLDLSFSRLERRVAVAAQFACAGGMLDVVATHLALGDRTRHRQVRSLLDHPNLRTNPTVLLGDMNAWRRCRATRALDGELRQHHNLDWPASFPSASPVLALDRIYARGARVVELFAHSSRAAKRASDHLPIIARVELE